MEIEKAWLGSIVHPAPVNAVLLPTGKGVILLKMQHSSQKQCLHIGSAAQFISHDEWSMNDLISRNNMDIFWDFTII